MGCACGKNRKTLTSYARSTSPSATPTSAPASTPIPASVTDVPTTVRFPDGSEQTYATRLEAHAARMIAGGGEILPG